MRATVLETFWRHRSLVYELTKRKFTGRYRGSLGGVAWSFVQPLFLLSVYTLAFGIILKARWGFSGGTADYALMLFAGLIIYNAFSESLSQASTLITENPNFVKKVVFPLELLPVVMVATAMLHLLIGLLAWLLGYMLLFGWPRLTAMYVPLVLVCLVPLLLGVGWLFSSLGVVLRDIGQVAQLISHTLLFLTPIFYSTEAAPPLLQNLLLLNPLTFVVDQFRLVLFYGHVPAALGLGVYFCLACVFAGVCLMLFRRLRHSFADLV
jgi:lipopolysaccharide transport system permease protein